MSQIEVISFELALQDIFQSMSDKQQDHEQQQPNNDDSNTKNADKVDVKLEPDAASTENATTSNNNEETSGSDGGNKDDIVRASQPHNYTDYSRLRQDEKESFIKPSSAANPFPLMLHKLLDSAEKSDFSRVVAWKPHGRAFHVYDKDKFVKEVMPLYFRQTQFASFQRQLNLYGFRRLTRQGPDQGAYYNPFFLRGMPELCANMVRKKVNGNEVRLGSSPRTEPDFYAMPPVNVPAIEQEMKARKPRSSNSNTPTRSRQAPETLSTAISQKIDNTTGKNKKEELDCKPAPVPVPATSASAIESIDTSAATIVADKAAKLPTTPSDDQAIMPPPASIPDYIAQQVSINIANLSTMPHGALWNFDFLHQAPPEAARSLSPLPFENIFPPPAGNLSIALAPSASIGNEVVPSPRTLSEIARKRPPPLNSLQHSSQMEESSVEDMARFLKDVDLEPSDESRRTDDSMKFTSDESMKLSSESSMTTNSTKGIEAMS